LLRFLIGGLATVAGLVLLLVASFGDPELLLRQFDVAFSTVVGSHTPAGAPPAQSVVSLAQSQSEPAPPPQQASQAQSAESSSAPDQAADMRALREALQRQLEKLQAETAQASQTVASLHKRADTERDDLATLQQRRAVLEAQAAQRAASQQATQAPTPSTSQATPAAAQPETQAVLPAPAQVAQVAQAADQPAALPLPPPLPPDMPQQVPPPTAAAAPSPQVVARTDATDAAYGAGQKRPQPVAQADSTALQAVLGKLRHDSSGVAPQAVAPGSDIVGNDGNSSGTRNAGTAPGAQQPTGPHERLQMARAALQAGRVGEAQQYLEEAQLQLVFRPVMPTGDDASVGSRTAGDVASALSMLGSGNISAALYYVDRAMGHMRPAAFSSQGSYSAGPYAGAPVPYAGVAEAGQ
jgi:hypothetical protein